MEVQDISAFAAYSANKNPKKLNFNLKKKSRLRLKKKLKSNECSVSSGLKKKFRSSENRVNSGVKRKLKSLENSVNSDLKKKLKLSESNANTGLNTFVSDVESSTEENISVKNKKKCIKKKQLIKSIVETEKESIFKDCTVTNKVDNIFFTENGFSEKSNSNKKEKGSEKRPNDINKPKKLKKKKIVVDEQVKIKDSENNSKYVKNSFLSDGKEGGTESDFSKNNIELLKKNSKNKLEESEQELKLPNFIYSDSVKVGEEVFSWMLNPLSLNEFFDNCWEQKPLHIEHNDKSYFKFICNLEDFKAALREHDMFFTRNIDVTSYVDGKRNTENPEGKAKPAIVWDFYKNGRSIRLLNPQTYIQNIRLLNTALQEFFHCFVGANIYLTPPGTQGFAPHYDDIEAFVLQLEGEKHWKLYNPRSSEEVLPRESSKNFSDDEIGEPILEVTLQPGDLLYFPRGIIHQAKCLPHIHSLHLTVSCYQKNSWADLFEKVLPIALQNAISKDVEFRKGLPMGYLNSLGMVYSDRETVLRQKIIKKFEYLAQKVLYHCPLDAGVDQMGANFVHDALPPCLTEGEKLHGASRDFRIEDENVLRALKNSSVKNLSVKLIRATCVRLVSEEEEMILYYTTDNSLIYHEHEVFSVCITTQWAQAVEYLIHSYPKFVEMKELPVSNKVNKPGKWKRIVEFVYFLWQKGLLLFDQPLLQTSS